ncbi:MAG: HNH endonuclease [Chloroflexota bacterium]
MPMQRELYPDDWDKIALGVKVAANWTCTQCGRPCREPKRDWAEFIHTLRTEHGDEMANEVTIKPVRFVLTVAHLDRNPANSDESNLKALCTVCHLRYDAPHNAQNATKTRRRKREQRAKEAGQLKLFFDV